MLSLVALAGLTPAPSRAQVPPTVTEAAAYKGLHAAAHRGDLVAIQRLSADKAALEARDNAGRTPLHVATFGRQHRAVQAPFGGGARHRATLKALLDAGASTKLADRGGATPLQLAKARGYTAMVQMLTVAGAR
jgi:uncharacterized protein